MAIYDLYGIKSTTINDARDLVERLLSLKFEEHDSDYHRGQYFLCGQMGQENFEIKVNLDPYEDVPNEDDFPEYEILLYVNDTPRSGELRAALTSSADIKPLRHEDLK
jgi:capsid portal protein